MATHLNLPPHGKRLIYDLGDFGLPEIPYLAAQNLPFTSTGLPNHTHRERMEINLLLKGERVYCVDGKSYHLRGNHAFITWPHEMHGSGSYLHGRGLHFWMQAVVPKPGSSFLGFDAERARPLLDAIWNIPRRHFKAAAGMRDLYTRMLVICRRGPSPLAGIELSALLAEWFLLLTKSASAELDEAISPDIARALELMAKFPDDHPTIEELASAACLSESRFKGKFREQMGMPPGEYLLRRLTEKAAELLTKKNSSLTEIALQLGFASAQHFSTTFKKFFGLSPLSWLKKQESEALAWPSVTDHKGDPSPADNEPIRPWKDKHGQLHGYVYTSYRGNHPD